MIFLLQNRIVICRRYLPLPGLKVTKVTTLFALGDAGGGCLELLKSIFQGGVTPVNFIHVAIFSGVISQISYK
jgi:hypothetical protein